MSLTVNPVVQKERIDILDSLRGVKSFNSKNSPGVAVTILQNGKPIAKKTYGMAVLNCRFLLHIKAW